MTLRAQLPRDAESGSALLIAVLVLAVLSLLGISFLLMADTENRIAENERLSAQTLYFGEAVIRETKRWFDRPPYRPAGALNLVKPTTAIMNRTLRHIDLDGDGPIAPVTADGTMAKPYYKVGVDRDANGEDDIFDKPYREALADMFVGTETGPDVRIERAVGGATSAFLDAVGDLVAPEFPAGVAGLRARVTLIDVYAPPYVNVGGTWKRYGVATVKVTVEIVRTSGTQSEILASRIVKASLSEIPFNAVSGPLHSCTTLTWSGPIHPHWGAVSTAGDANPNGRSHPESIPREIPLTRRIDLLHGWQAPAQDAVWATLKASLEQGRAIEDPWWRLLVIGVNQDAATVLTRQLVAPSPTDPDVSNSFHRLGGLVGCPEFDYGFWKWIAQSGGSDVHYYAWENGVQFKENGVGVATDVRALTDQKTGLFFFDTMNGAAPDSTGSNLTPAIDVDGGTYGTRGMLYINAVRWRTSGLAGRPVDMVWPGEPFRDSNRNGVRDAAEDWINLDFNALASLNDPAATPTGSSTDDYGNPGGGPVWNKYGPPITGQAAAVWGVLYVAGELDADGSAGYYGGVVSKAGLSSHLTGTPELWWDPRILDDWPPLGWELPRVMVSGWRSDP